MWRKGLGRESDTLCAIDLDLISTPFRQKIKKLDAHTVTVLLLTRYGVYAE